jgi:hypothetical protein
MSFQPVVLYAGCMAEEGRKTLPISLAFTVAVPNQVIYLQQLQTNFGKFTGVQTMYVDNADNAADVIITMPETQQRIIAKANTQGYYPVLSVQGSAVFNFNCAANITVAAQLLNFMVAPATWSA